MATFKFCKLCSNLLYPREDKEDRKLFYACRNCIHQEETDNKCVYRNELMNSANETTTIIRDIACDPTLPRTEKECPECGYMEAVYFEQQSRRSGRSDTRMVLYYACANTECGYRWTDYSDKPKPSTTQDEDTVPEYLEEDNYMNDIYNTQGLENTYQDPMYLNNNNITLLEPEIDVSVPNIQKGNEYHNPEDW